jgi:flagellar assembly factor FliW
VERLGGKGTTLKGILMMTQPTGNEKNVTTAGAAGGIEKRCPFPGTTPRVIVMKRGIPGFEQVRRYHLVAKDENNPFCLLRGVDGSPVFVVVDPLLVCPDYDPVIPEREARFLELKDESEAALLVIVAIRREPHSVTVNLRAPLLVNTGKNLAVQVVLEDQDWPVRHAIMS